VIKDIIGHPNFSTTDGKATIITDKFKNTRLKMFLKQELDTEDGRISNNMPVITRWGSHLKMYCTLAAHKEAMLSIMENSDAAQFISEDLRHIVCSSEFWCSLDALTHIIKPIADATVELEKDKSIANVYKQWISLENVFNPTQETIIPVAIKYFVREKLSSRWKLIEDDIHFLSFLFDPHCRNVQISVDQLRKIFVAKDC